MAVRTKPVRLLEADDAILTLLAGALRRNRTEVAHAAIGEYVRSHSRELSGLFGAAQKAIAAGDVDALVAVAAPALKRQLDDLVASLPQPEVHTAGDLGV